MEHSSLSRTLLLVLATFVSIPACGNGSDRVSGTPNEGEDTGDLGTADDGSTDDESTDDDSADDDSTDDESTDDDSADDDSTDDDSADDESTDDDPADDDATDDDPANDDSTDDDDSNADTEPSKDVEPDPFAFEPQSELGTHVYAFSGPVTISGIEGKVAISIEGGQYSIDGDSFTAADGTIQNGQSIEVRQVTARTTSTTTKTEVTVGSVTEIFETTTRATLTNSPPRTVLPAADASFHSLLAEDDIATGMQLHVIRVADLNQDGHVDLVASFNTLGIVWLENDGASDPSFEVHEIVAPPSSSSDDIELGDLDEDGDVDLVVELAAQGVVWFENGGGSDPIFTEHPMLAPTPETGSISSRLDRSHFHLLDIDGDEDLDIQFVEQNGSGDTLSRLDWLENDGAEDPSFTLVELFETPSFVRDVAAGDVTGDGRPEFVLQDSDNGMTLLTNDGATDPTFSRRDLADDAIYYRAATISDWDQDGDDDLLVSDYDRNRLLFFESDGAEAPSFEVKASMAVPQVTELTALDMDGDGDPDVLTDSFLNVRAAGQLDRLEWYQNTGTFADRSVVLQANRRSEDYGWLDVVAADLTGDGVLELITNRQEDAFDGVFFPPFGWYDLTDVSYAVTQGTSSAEPLANHITDIDDNKLTYAILGGPDQSHFSIDETAGRLNFEAPPREAPSDYDRDNVYRVWLSVDDGYLTTNFLFAVTVVGD